MQEVAPGRANAIVIARGSGGGKNLMLNGHIDVVGLADMTDPFGARIEGNKMYGRGVYDMKAGVAASLMAAKRAATLNLRRRRDRGRGRRRRGGQPRHAGRSSLSCTAGRPMP